MRRKLISLLLFCLLVVFTANQVEARPSYKQGYARSAAESTHPELWRGLVGVFVPNLGVTGGTLFDHSAFKNHGTLTNMDPATDWVVDKNGYVLSFDGTDDIVRIANSGISGHRLDFTTGQPFSIAVLFDTGVGTPTGTLFNKRDDADDQYQLFIDGQARLAFRAGGEIGYEGANDSIVASTEYFGVVTVDASGQPNLSLNGSPLRWNDETGTAPFIFTHRAVDVTIGARWASDPTTGYQLPGNIKIVYVYDRVIIQNEVQALRLNPLAMFELRPLIYKAPAAVAARRIISIN